MNYSEAEKLYTQLYELCGSAKIVSDDQAKPCSEQVSYYVYCYQKGAYCPFGGGNGICPEDITESQIDTKK